MAKATENTNEVVADKNTPTAQDVEQSKEIRLAGGKIVKGKTGTVSVDDLEFYPSNARTPDELRTNAIRLAGLIEANGYDPSQPIVVCARPDGKIFVLRGNGRLAAVRLIQETKPEAYAKLFPKGMLPAVILKGLTPAEECSINADHSSEHDRMSLSAWGIFLQVYALRWIAGLTSRFAVAEKLGLYSSKKDSDGNITRELRASYAQQLLNLAAMPLYVRDAFRMSNMFGYAGADAHKQLKSSQIAGLYTVLLEVQGKPEMIGKSIDEIGEHPTFKAKWQEVMGAEVKPEGPKAPTAKIVETAVAGSVSPLIRDAMLLAVGKKKDASLDTHLAPLVQLASQLESDSQMLGMIREHLGAADFAELCEKARATSAERTAKAEAAKAAEAAAGVVAHPPVKTESEPVNGGSVKTESIDAEAATEAEETVEAAAE